MNTTTRQSRQGMRMWHFLLFVFLFVTSCMTSGNYSGDGAGAQDNGDPSQADDNGSDQSGLKGDVTGTLPNGVTSSGGNVTVSPNTLDGNLIYETRYPFAYVGRFDMTNPNAPRFSLPNTKIGIRFTGTSLGVYFSDDNNDSFDVEVDGVTYAAVSNQFSTQPGTTAPCLPYAQVPAANGNDWPGCLLLLKTANMTTPSLYPVVSNLPPGEHIAWLTKRTEFLQYQLVGTAQFYGVKLDEGATLLSPPPYRKRRIEVIGDSSTSGYGSAQLTPCSFTERNCNGAIALPGQLGNFLHSEVVNISSSGQAVYQSYYDNNASHLLPVMYARRLPLETPAYDFSLDHVDVIVLSAGGDDLWGASGSGAFNNRDGKTDQSSARGNFVTAYTNWLTDMRSKRPDAFILCMLSYAAYDNDITLLGGAIQEVVANRNRAGDANVAYFMFYPTNDPVVNPKGYQDWRKVKQGEKFVDGCSGHPTPIESRYMAKAVGPVIAARMGWTDIGFAP